MVENSQFPQIRRNFEAISERLIATREALKYSQSEFADGAEISRNTYNQWEKAKGRPSLDKAYQLCDRYMITLDWIYLGNPRGLPSDVWDKIRKHRLTLIVTDAI